MRKIYFLLASCRWIPDDTDTVDGAEIWRSPVEVGSLYLNFMCTRCAYFLLFGTNLEVFFPPKKWGQQKNLVGPPSPPSGRGYKVGPFTSEIMGLQQLING